MPPFRKVEAEESTSSGVYRPGRKISVLKYEYSVREDILMALEERDVTVEQGSALLDSPSPLADIYREWPLLAAQLTDPVDFVTEWRQSKLHPW